MDARDKTLKLLSECGAVLVRTKNHPVYRLPNGLIQTVPKTASDWRSWANTLSQLRTALGLRAEYSEGERRKRPRPVTEPFRPFELRTLQGSGVKPRTLKEQLTTVLGMGDSTAPVYIPPPAAPIKRKYAPREKKETQHGVCTSYSPSVIHQANEIMRLFGEEKYKEFMRDVRNNQYGEEDMQPSDIERLVQEAKGKMKQIENEILGAKRNVEDANKVLESKINQEAELKTFIDAAELTLEHAKIVAPLFKDVATPTTFAKAEVRPEKEDLLGILIPKMNGRKYSIAEMYGLLLSMRPNLTRRELDNAIVREFVNRRVPRLHKEGAKRATRYWA